MTVFIPWTGYEDIGGVYLTLEEAKKHAASDFDIEEYEVGSEKRIRSYTHEGILWWANGKDLRFDNT